MKAEEILRKYLSQVYVAEGNSEITDEEWADPDGEMLKANLIRAMKDYAEYIAKCAHRDLRHDLVATFYRTDLSEVDFDNIIMNHQFIAPKELLQ